MSNFSYRNQSICTAVALLTPWMARAEPTPELQTITITSRAERPLIESIGTVSLITANELDFALQQDLRDVAATEPGLAVRNDPGRFGFEGIAIRGIGGNRVAVEVDGVPLSKAFAIGNFSSAGRLLPDLTLAERLEILRGPASALYGSDALGGVVSVSTWRPRRWLESNNAPTALRAKVGFDSADDSRRALLQAAAETRAVAAMLAIDSSAGSATQSEGNTLGPNPRDYRSDSALLRLELGRGDSPLEAGVSVDRFRQTTNLLALIGQPGRFATTTSALGDDESKRTTAFLAYSLGEDTQRWGRWSARLFYTDIDTVQLTDENRRAAPPRQPQPLRIEREFQFQQRLAGLKLVGERSGSLWNLEHRALWGLDYLDSRITELRNGRQTSLQTGTSTQLILGESFPLRDFPISDSREIGLFVEDEIRPQAGRWTLRAGLRADETRLEPRPDAIWLADNPNVPVARVARRSLSPRLGWSWAVTPDARLFAQYAHGFRAPPFEDVNIGLDLPSIGVRALPNPDLQPERSDGIELGVRTQRSRLYGTVSLFATRYRDLIESKVNLGRDPVSGLTLFQSRNVAAAEIYGLEADLRAELSEWSASLDQWSVRFTATLTEGRDTRADRPLNAIDPARITFASRYRSPSDRASVELRVTNVFAKSAVADPPSGAQLVRTGGYALVDLSAQFSLGQKTTFRLGANNLLDRPYREWADVRGLTIDDPLLPLYQRPGRNLSLNLDWRY